MNKVEARVVKDAFHCLASSDGKNATKLDREIKNFLEENNPEIIDWLGKLDVERLKNINQFIE